MTTLDPTTTNVDELGTPAGQTPFNGTAGGPLTDSGMDTALTADTPAGARMVALAERLARSFGAGAACHDRDASFAAEHLERLKVERFLVAPIPAELGGGGVDSLHDVLVAMSRLARGDAATSIGVNMHFAVLSNIVRRLQVAHARGERPVVAALRAMLPGIAAADVVFSTAVSEPSPQDLTRPSTRATRTEGGWRVDGRKVFATMAPYATLVNVGLTYTAADGTERYGFALVPPGAPGVTFAGDWDALGMRASESGSVTFDGVQLGADGVRDGFPAGRYGPELLERFLASGAFHAAASLGVAEAAQAHILGGLRRRAEAVASDAFTMTRLAENVVDLSSMRASFDRAGRLIDEHFAADPTGEATLAEVQAVYAEVQAAKAHITAGASRVVDRALALSGGAGFMASHPLAMLWRDARAGAFMHPLGANRAEDFLARAALGLDPR